MAADDFAGCFTRLIKLVGRPHVSRLRQQCRFVCANSSGGVLTIFHCSIYGRSTCYKDIDVRRWLRYGTSPAGQGLCIVHGIYFWDRMLGCDVFLVFITGTKVKRMHEHAMHMYVDTRRVFCGWAVGRIRCWPRSLDFLWLCVS